MPLYPFILLGAVFVAVLVLPPLIAAFVDYRRELMWEAARSAGGAARASPTAPGRSDD